MRRARVPSWRRRLLDAMANPAEVFVTERAGTRASLTACGGRARRAAGHRVGR